ncbi:hypothetical protein JCM5353_007514 [Sporobolomyces roseus]
MTIDLNLLFDLILPYLLPLPPPSPLIRPSFRYSLLLQLSLVTRSIRTRVLPMLYSEVFISSSDSQLNPFLAALSTNESLALKVKSLEFVSRHNEVKYWDVKKVQAVIKMCRKVEELVLVIPTEFGLPGEFLSPSSSKRMSFSSRSLHIPSSLCRAIIDLKSLTLASPLQPPLVSIPPFSLLSLSILPSLHSSLLSFTPTLKYLSPALSSVQNLSLADSHSRPLSLSSLPPLPNLTALALPAHTQSRSYSNPDRYTCDPAPPLHHPSRELLDHLAKSSPNLETVYLPSLGHLGAIHHLPTSVTSLVIGPSEVKDREKLRELESCLINSKEELREVGLMLKRGKREVNGIEEELKRMRDELEREKGSGLEWKWV